jgi:hypothetical protein
MVKRTWTALDGRLVFDVDINPTARASEPSLVTVRCVWFPPETVTYEVFADPPTEIDLNFKGGGYVHGKLYQSTGFHIDGDESTGIHADICFSPLDRTEEIRFEGLMVACPLEPPGPEPHPRPHPAPGPGPGPLPVVTGQFDELFPYVYVRRWPRVTDADLHYGFIHYAEASPPADSFFADLVAVRHDRAAAEACAIAFIDGDGAYKGRFAPGLRALGGPLQDFAHAAEQLMRRDPRQSDWLDLARTELDAILRGRDEAPDYFRSHAYLTALDRVWHSYFALVVTLGYDPALLDELAAALWFAHLIAAAPELTLDGAPPLTRHEVAQIANATVVLPKAVFPLAPAPPAAASPPTGRGWIEPYAIGDLQMVRQRLVRYVPGEIARIENVMRGERKEISSRRKHRHQASEEHSVGEEQVLANDDADQRTSLLEQALRTVASKTVTTTNDSFQSSYGPPTQATLTGSWTRATVGVAPGYNDVTRFARDVLNKTVSRISRHVGSVRSSSSLSQVEDAVSSVIDNTAGQTSVRAIFRWVNKVYEASVVTYGNRLMMELLVTRPGADFIARQAALAGDRLAKPVAPALSSFEDISPTTYAAICAAYGVTDVRPPPSAVRFVTASLRSGEERQMAIPAGYDARHAFVTCVTTPSGLPPPQVMVGLQILVPGAAHAALKAWGEDATIPVCVGGLDPPKPGGGSPPEAEVEAAPDPPPAPTPVVLPAPTPNPEALVNVQIACAPTARAMDEWRIGVYGAVIRAYREQVERYYAQVAAGRSGEARSPLANRRIEQGELKAACVRLMMDRMAALTGAPDAGLSPPASLVDAPRYLQFLDDALEWGEMSYVFHAGSGPADDPSALGLDATGDPLFASFLQAGQARVLLPVRPARQMAFLYFLSSGLVWDGDDRLIAADSDEVSLVNDLKLNVREGRAQITVGPSWDIVVPTAMQVLDDAAGAPGLAFGGAGR